MPDTSPAALTDWVVPVSAPVFRDDRYLALARTLAQPVQPDAPLSEAAMLARLAGIEARFGNGAMASMCILTRNGDTHRVGVTVLDAQYSIIAQTTAATFAAALDAMERRAPV